MPTIHISADGHIGSGRPPVEVLGLGSEDWTDRDAGQEHGIDAHRWERYGTVEVRIGDVTYEVGCVIGVAPALRGTAAAAGGDVDRPAYLSAWYTEAADWQSAPASRGRDGIPAERADDVIAAIKGDVARLWEAYLEELTDVEGEEP